MVHADDFDSLNEGKSLRFGDTVYYDPRDSGPYTDGQDALADVPPGGEFRLAPTVYDVTTEGRLYTTSPLAIRGTGWGRESGGGADVGTRLINTGSDSVNSPVIEFDGSANTVQARRPEVRGVKIQHSPAGSYAIEVNNMTRSLIIDSDVDCVNNGFGGVHYTGRAFFARMVRSRVKAFSDFGIHVQGSGFAHEFLQCQTSTTVDNGGVGLQTECDITYVIGGEYATNTETTTGTSIRFWNPEASQKYGGYVNTTFESSDIGVDIDGDTARFDQVHVVNPYATLEQVGTIVRWGASAGSTLRYPVIFIKAGGGQLAHWTVDSLHCGIISNYGSVGGASYTDDGASSPYIVVPQVLSNGFVAALPTGTVPVWVAYNTSVNSPTFYDGTNWYEQSSANTTYTP